MLAATHFDNLLVPLFFGIAVLFQLLSAAAAKKRKERDNQTPRSTSPSQTPRPDENEDDTERIRKFLEALGQPTSSRPPPPVESRPTYQKPIVVPRKEPEPIRRRSVMSPLPPLTTRPPDLPVETRPPVIPTRETPTFEVQAGPPPLESLTEVEAKTGAVTQVTAKPHDLATMLRSTSGLRDAIILREIFGPPRSMQPLDLVGSV